MRAIALLALLACDPPPAPQSGLGIERIEIDAETITHLAFVPGRADELLVTEHAGTIAHYRIEGTRAQRLGSFDVPEVMQEVDCGLLAIAFDPEWETNHFVYAGHCSGAQFRSRITRLTWDGETYDVSEVATIIDVLEANPPGHAFNHSIGNIGFEPDGTMFFSIGDKGNRASGSDPTDIPGSLLRIVPNRDPAGEGYTPAAGNPFTDPAEGAPEIYAYGLRFGFRATRDSAGRFFVGDVGEGTAEEVNLVDEPGLFLGWDQCEGPCETPVEGATDPLLWWRAMDETHPYYADDPETEASTRNVVFVGEMQPDDVPDVYDGLLADTVVFGEVCLGWVRGARVDDAGAVTDDRFLFHLAHVVGWTYASDGTAYAATFGSCDSTMMFDPASLWRVTLDP
jgi:glucose/arabinose dehydrogenase